MVNLVEQVWESSMLGYKCGSLDFGEQENAAPSTKSSHIIIQKTLKKAKSENYQFLTAKVPAENNELINICFRNNGYLVDTELTFSKSRREINLEQEAILDVVSVEKLDVFWDESLRKLTDTIIHSRFFSDANIKNEAAHRLWENSIYNNCNGRASYSIIAHYNGKVAGLINVFEKDGRSDIFLIGVLSQFQNKGIGKAMIQCYEGKLDKSILELTVDTQSINYGAQRFYIGMGYRTVSVKQIIHFWI